VYEYAYLIAVLVAYIVGRAFTLCGKVSGRVKSKTEKLAPVGVG